ncbi:MAG: hypothetical protein R8M45_01560, partial [Ghiorsea sp.]
MNVPSLVIAAKAVIYRIQYALHGVAAMTVKGYLRYYSDSCLKVPCHFTPVYSISTRIKRDIGASSSQTRNSQSVMNHLNF